MRQKIIASAKKKALFLPHAAKQMSRPDRMITIDEIRESPAIGQKYGEKCAAAVDLQPTTSKSDRLLDHRRPFPRLSKVGESDTGTTGCIHNRTDGFRPAG
jgi:hypothetical protein